MGSRLLSRVTLIAGCLTLGLAGPAAASFSIVPSPNAFAGNNALGGVSASSPTDAWAVGRLCCAFDDSGIGTLTEHWDGLAWTRVASPDTVFNDDILDAVSDLGPGDAWAVGLVKRTGFKSGSPLIVHWNGANWSSVPAPSGLTGVLRGVSGDSASDVWAVGDDGRGHAVALHWTGAAWSTVALPSVAAGDMLQAVKAFSPTDVWAVGDGQPNSLSTAVQTLTMHWNGSSWSVVSSPNPDPNSDILHALDGTSSSNLWAVGQQALDETVTGVPPGTRTLTEHWNGVSWSAVPSLNVGDQDTLQGAAAPTPTTLLAVGTYEQTGGSIPIQRTLAQRWNGTSWLPQVSANSGPTDNLLQAASAVPGAGYVWAVGFRLTSSGVDQTLIEQGTNG